MQIYGGKHTSINSLKRLPPGQEQLKELEIFFQRLLSIVCTTLSFNLNSIIVIVEKLCLQATEASEPCCSCSNLSDMMLIPHAYLYNLTGKT